MNLSYTATTSRIDRKQQKSRLYLSVANENILEHLQNRFDRPVNEYKKLIAPVLKMLGVEKARWSQKAGCSCGCSPGFILDRKVQVGQSGVKSVYNWESGHDIHVTIAGAPKNDGHPRNI